jgi:hypothetical protein
MGESPSNRVEGQKRFASIENDEGARLQKALEEIEGFPYYGELQTVASPRLKTVAAAEIALVGEVECQLPEGQFHVDRSFPGYLL